MPRRGVTYTHAMTFFKKKQTTYRYGIKSYIYYKITFFQLYLCRAGPSRIQTIHVHVAQQFVFLFCGQQRRYEAFCTAMTQALVVCLDLGLGLDLVLASIIAGVGRGVD